MNPRKWLVELPLFGKAMCVYCGGIADSSDHTPPRCLLPRKWPSTVHAMTVPACRECNGSFSKFEQLAAAIVATVSFEDSDRAAVAPGGMIHAALKRDSFLSLFIYDRLGDDGRFCVDQMVLDAFGCVFSKTAIGLLFWEFGRVVSYDELKVVDICHTKQFDPLAFAESYRRDDEMWPEVTESCRKIERAVVAWSNRPPPFMTSWTEYIPRYFDYFFLRRSNNRLLCGMRFHNTVMGLLECPWPNKSGPRRARTRC